MQTKGADERTDEEYISTSGVRKSSDSWEDIGTFKHLFPDPLPESKSNEKTGSNNKKGDQNKGEVKTKAVVVGNKSSGGNGGGAQGQGGSWLSDFWNNSTIMKIIPDVIYINTSYSYNPGKGPGSGTIGYALPIRGKQALHLYAYSSGTKQYGAHAAVAWNVGYSSYPGDARNFNFENSFGGNSSGWEEDLLLGVGHMVSGKDNFGIKLYSNDIGFGPSVGASYNRNSITSLMKIW